MYRTMLHNIATVSTVLLFLQITHVSSVGFPVYYYSSGDDCSSSVQQICALSVSDSLTELSEQLNLVVTNEVKIVKFKFHLESETLYEIGGIWSPAETQEIFDDLNFGGYWLKDRHGHVTVALNPAVRVLSLGTLTVGARTINVHLNLSLNADAMTANQLKSKPQYYRTCSSNLKDISRECQASIEKDIIGSVVDNSLVETQNGYTCHRKAENNASSGFNNYHCRNYDDEESELSPPLWLSSVYMVLVVVEHIVAFSIFPFVLLYFIPSRKRTGRMFNLMDSGQIIVIEDENLMTDSPTSPVSLTSIICRSTKAKDRMVRKNKGEHRSCCQIFWYSCGRFLLYCGLLPIFCHLGYFIYNVVAKDTSGSWNKFESVSYAENFENNFFYFFDQNFMLPFAYSLTVYGFYMVSSFLVVLSEADGIFTQTIEIDDKTFHHYYTQSCDLYDITRVMIDGRTIVYETISNFLRQAVLNDCRNIRDSNCCLKFPLISFTHHLSTVLKKISSLKKFSCCHKSSYLVLLWFLSFPFVVAMSLHILAEICMYTILGFCFYLDIFLPYCLLAFTLVFYACYCLAKVQHFYSKLKNAIFHICCHEQNAGIPYAGDTLHIIPVVKSKRHNSRTLDRVSYPRYVDAKAGVFKRIPVLSDKAPRDSITKDTFKQVCDFVRPIGTAYVYAFVEFLAIAMFVSFMFTVLILADLSMTVTSGAIVAIATLPYLIQLFFNSSISSVSEGEALLRSVAVALSRLTARHCVYDEAHMAAATAVAVFTLSDMIATAVTPLSITRRFDDDENGLAYMNGLTDPPPHRIISHESKPVKKPLRESSFSDSNPEVQIPARKSRKEIYKLSCIDDKSKSTRSKKNPLYQKKAEVRLEDYTDDADSPQTSVDVHRTYESTVDKSSGRASRLEMYTFYGKDGKPSFSKLNTSRTSASKYSDRSTTEQEDTDTEKKRPRHSSSFGSSSNKLRKQNRREWVSDEDVRKLGNNRIHPEETDIEGELEGTSSNQDDVAV